MKDVEAENRRVENGSDQTFAQAAMEVLNWEREGFQGKSYEESEALGKEDIREAFRPDEGEVNDFEKLSSIVRFLASRMNTEGAARLRADLDQKAGVKSISVPSADADTTPVGVLKEVLAGAHDRKIEDAQVAARGDVYTMALYLYLNTSGNSEEEMAEVLSRLIATYDDPHVSRYEVGADGIGMTPYLASMCEKAIEQYGLHEEVRGEVRQTLETLPSQIKKDIGKSNAWRVGVNWEAK